MKVLKLNRHIEPVMASIGAFQSIYLGVYSFFERKRDVKNYLLGLFFFSISLRIIKSIFWIYYTQTPDWFINLGFTAHLAFGPLLFLYVFYFLNVKKWSHVNWLHFIPSGLIIANSFSISLDGFWNSGGYEMLLYHQLIYTFCLTFIFIKGYLNRANFALQKKDWLWLSLLVIGTTFLQLSYFSNYILGLMPYLLGPIVYGTFIFFLSFFLIKNPQLLKQITKTKKHSHINLTSSHLSAYAEKIDELMQTKRPYLDSSYNLKRLSKSSGLPVYLVSHIVNNYFGRNFSEYINGYRITEAKKLLKDSDYQNIKISSIAYECGFNSLSAFNSAFKRHTGLTPSAFKSTMTNL